jgi:DNA-binding transcriptional LysR family regulator
MRLIAPYCCVMTTISLDLVPPFLAVAELGSFSAAATRLGVEKSSVSRAVARLEEGVGDKLFLRTTRRVSLTDAGQTVSDRLREPHANLDAALKAVLETATSPRGRLVVTAPADFAGAILTEALVRFARRHPHVEVDVRVSNQFFDLAKEGIDAAIRITVTRLVDSTLKVRKLGELNVGVFAAPSYAESRGAPRSPEEARSHPWILFPAFRDVPFRGPGGTVRVKPGGRLSCNEMTTILHAVIHGAGLGVLPSFLADAELRQGRLVQVLSRWTVAGGHIWFVTPAARQRTAPLVDALRECVTDVLVARGLTPPRQA